jgi:predicted outer membrane repeat protein
MKTLTLTIVTCALVAASVVPLALLGVLAGPALAANSPAVTFSTSGGTAGQFGTVDPAGNPYSQTITLTNTGGSATSSLTLSVGPDPASPSTPPATFRIKPGSDACTGSSLGPNKSCQVTIQYFARAGQTDRARLKVDTPKQKDSLSTDRQLSGTGGAASVAISPASFDFGQVGAGTKQFTATNTGNLPTSPYSFGATGSAQLAAQAGTCTGASLAAAGGSCQFSVSYTATSCGGGATYQQTVQLGALASATVQAEEPACPKLRVLDETSQPVGQTSFDFGTNGGTSHTFTFENTGAGPGVVDTGTASLAGGVFVSDNGCSHSNLAPGGTCTLKITFSPAAGCGSTDSGSVAYSLSVPGAGSVGATSAEADFTGAQAACGPPPCATNTRTNHGYGTLQAAQDAATDGDTLTVNGTCVGPTTVSHDLTINGAGASPTLDGNQLGSVLTIQPGETVTVSGLTITNGLATNGGGVNIRDGATFTLNDDRIVGNTATGTGGGVYADPGSNGTLTGGLVDSNKAGFGGGVAVVAQSTMAVQNTTVSNNQATVDGGGVYADHSTVQLTDVHVDTNEAGKSGGGVALGTESVATIDNSTINDNQATTDGAGFSCNGCAGSMTSTTVKFDTGAAPVVSVVNGDLSIASSLIPVRTDEPVNNYAQPALAIFNYVGQYKQVTITGSTIDGGIYNVGNPPATLSIDAFSTVTGGITTAGGSPCVHNQQLNHDYPSLQSAQDLARAGDVLQLTADCVGTTNFTRNVDVDGQSTYKIDGNGAGTPVVVQSGASVHIANVTITNGVNDFGGGIANFGVLSLNGVTVSGNTANADGGGIYNTGLLHLGSGTVISGNHATGATTEGYGGGIYNQGSVDASSVHIDSNTALLGGGGIFNDHGSLLLVGAALSANSTSGDGGGIYLSGGSLDYRTGTTITSNFAAGTGGGIFNHFGSAGISDDGTNTVSGNLPNDIV